MAVQTNQYPGIKRIIAQDYHRNGIGGNGTIVTIFEPEPEEGIPAGPFLAMTIDPELVGDHVPTESRVKYRGGFVAADEQSRLIQFAANTYAVHLGMAVDGDIEFTSNSWRAGDHWGPGIAEAWRDRCVNPTESWGHSYDPFKDIPVEDGVKAINEHLDFLAEGLNDRIAEMRKQLEAIETYRATLG